MALLLCALQTSAAWMAGGLPSRPAVSSQSPARVARAITMEADYYRRLGIQRNADEKEIKNVRCAAPVQLTGLPTGSHGCELRHALAGVQETGAAVAPGRESERRG